MRVKSRIEAQPKCLVGRRSVSLLLHSAIENCKYHAIDFDQPKCRAFWRTQLEVRYPEVPYSESGPTSFVDTRKVQDCRPSNSRYISGLGLMACGRRGLSIKEVDDNNMCRKGSIERPLKRLTDEIRLRIVWASIRQYTPMSTKTYTKTPDKQTKWTERERKIHTFRPASLKTRRSLSYTIITKFPVFDCAVALCTMQNELLVICNLTWLDCVSDGYAAHGSS
jgi:hypothetical protein